jgi:hypothetical protein
MRSLSALFDPGDLFPSGFGSQEISAAAEGARDRVRHEFEHIRAGIERLRAEASGGDGALYAISGGAERARERVRDEFDQLRVGIQKLRAEERR